MLFLQIYIMLFLKLVSDIHFFKLVMTYHKAVPEMDSRQMRLISYSGDQKLLQIR